MPIATPDAVIVGGGVAGLWMLNILRDQGYSVVLVEKNRLGGVQTMASQGVLHGGLKYALNGITDSSEAIRDMPARWQANLAGTGDIDLRSVNRYTDHQVFWSEPGLLAKGAASLGIKALAGRSEKIRANEAPEVLQHPDYDGILFRVHEPVIDVPSLVHALAEPHKDCLYFANEIRCSDDMVMADGQEFRPQRIILAAGAGNADFTDQPPMQRRPLHQVMLAMPDLPTFYSVCMGASPKPVLVTTSHETEDGTPVWYIGGNVAETGVDRNESEQIDFARQELERLLPWLNFDGARWGTVRVDRAEPEQIDGEKPVGAYCKERGSTIVTWPTKLVMAPLLGDEVLRLMPPPGHRGEVKVDLSSPVYATTPWRDL